MKRSRFGVPARLLALLTVVAAAGFASPASVSAATRASDDALSLVPSEAASIAVIRFNDLRSSPLASRLFNDADHVGGNGEAARFMEEANLKPRQDVDTAVVVGLMPSGGYGETPVLALFEGRFDPERLSAAALTRGATRVSTSAGDYFLLPEKSSSSNHGKGAVAFASARLVIGGTESAVASALAARSAGGTGFLSGAGLGGQLSRVDRGASVWALVDVSRYPKVQQGFSRGGNAHGGSDAGQALFGAMKSVTFFSFQATVHSDELALVATGVSPDAETRQLLEDSLRGVVAMWRLAVQEKQPDLVTVLRRFKIDSSGDAVTVSGTLPGSVVRSLAEKRSAAK